MDRGEDSMTDTTDEALVERVARSVCLAGGMCDCRGPRQCLDWRERDVQDAARAAIAAVRAHDAERGMVTVPKQPTDAMLRAGATGSGEDSESVALGAWEAMIAAAGAR
jgi:hypothetical protein